MKPFAPVTIVVKRSSLDRRHRCADKDACSSIDPFPLPQFPPPRLAFVVTEDWFFVSHFLPMIRAATEAGFEPLVIARVREHRGAIEAMGARVVPLEAERRSLDPFKAAATFWRLARILRRERVSAVHCIALRGILNGGVAAMLAGVSRRVFAVTGGGFLSAHASRRAKLSARVLRFAIRHLFRTRTTRYLFENEDDPRSFGLDQSEPDVWVVGGAGVDPDYFQPVPLPPTPPLRVAVVARMLWSKGVDLAVEAVRLARAAGAAVELSLYGLPDPSNPQSVPRATLEDWSKRDGITWHGRTSDVREVWAVHHIACLPSRGGEGLPRSILEAAACGRAVLTTDVPGCRSFVRDEVDGFVVPPDNAEALAEKLVALARDPVRVAAMGTNARARVLDGYREKDVVETVAALYRTLA
ncbi:glycosyltransferase family 4 protein [Mesorhizobium liriopis]|nr:glycosyltransferase family 4 protein [Mesorhizobium liriopis]